MLKTTLPNVVGHMTVKQNVASGGFQPAPYLLAVVDLWVPGEES